MHVQYSTLHPPTSEQFRPPAELHCAGVIDESTAPIRTHYITGPTPKAGTRNFILSFIHCPSSRKSKS